LKIDRRTLLVGSGAAAGLIVAYAAWPRGERPALLPGKEAALLGPAIAIARDGRVTVAVPAVETGQGIWTALAQVAAAELGADWNQVGVEPARTGSAWDNPLAEEQGWREGLGPLRAWRLPAGSFRITAGSTSVRAWEAPMRRLAATARALLIAEAADRWKVAAAECDTGGGMVRHEGKALPFGALAEGAARRQPPNEVPLRDTPAALSGQPAPRLDSPAKARGEWRFAGDVRLPGMLFASLRRSGGGAIRIESPAPRGVQFVTGDHWVAALAEDWWSAEQAINQATIRSFALVGRDEAAIDEALDRALGGDEFEPLISVGDVDGAFEGARPLTATYSAAAMSHQDLEPPSVTVRLGEDAVEIWAGSRAPELFRQAAARAAGISLGRTILYPLPIGGQGGTGLDADLLPIAVTLAQQAGRPVQLSVPRAEQVRGDAVRPPLKARLFARPLPDGQIAGWRLRLAGADGMSAALAALLGTEAGGFRKAALPAFPYGIPNVSVEASAADLPVKLGYHRGEWDGPLTFMTEGFIDELARIGGRDPLSQRMALLAGNPRLARCLLRATALSGWDGGGAGSQMGLAVLSAYGSHIAVVASAAVGTGGKIEVSRLVAAVDTGRVINPALVRQQIEGGMIAGIAAASAKAPSFLHGRVTGPLEPTAPGLAGTPEVLVEILASRAAPGGVNGLGWAAAPAAVANALAAATGRRLRALPLNPMS